MNTHDNNFAPDVKTAVDFLEKLRPSGPWVPTAILPDPKPGWPPTLTITAKTSAEVEAFVREHNGERNLYYSVNPTRRETTSKAAKTNIAAIEFALADLDPREDETAEAAKRRYLDAIAAGICPKPSFVIDSGNGIQLLWRLAAPIPLPAPIWGERPIVKGCKVIKGADGKPMMERVLVLSEEAKAIIDNVQPRIAAMMERLGSVAGTQNIDRILRLPGGMNLPNETKRKKGRVPCMSRLLDANDGVHSLDAFPLPEARAKDAKAGGKAGGKANADAKGGDKSKAGGPKKSKILPIEELRVSDRIKTIMKTGVDPESDSGDRSAAMFAACLALAAMGYGDEQFEAIFLDEKLPISAHVLERANPAEYLARQIVKAREKVPQFKTKSDGTRDPTSQLNIKRAVEKLGVTLRYDVFNDQTLIKIVDS